MAEVTNEQLVEKAVITTEAIASAGKLNAKQADRFIDYVINETVLKDNARIVKFRNETMDIDKIGVGARAAVPKSEATDPGVRRNVTHTKVTLTPKEVMVPFEMSDVYIDHNIEGARVEDHVIKMFATQFANDTEEIFVNGNALGQAVTEDSIYPGGSTSLLVKDSYLGMFDGWSKQAEAGNVVNAAGKNVGLSIFSQALRSMPTKFRRNKSKLRWIMSPDLWEVYLEKLATRATALGDAAASGGTHGPLGIKAVAVPLWDFQPTIVEHFTLSGANDDMQLGNTNVEDVVVTLASLGSAPTAALTLTTDYTVVAATGVVTAVDSGGNLGDGIVAKVTYSARPQFMLTHMDNLIVAIGRDIRIEKDRDIFKGVDQYAITAKIDCKFEEETAVVKVKNLGLGV